MAEGFMGFNNLFQYDVSSTQQYVNFMYYIILGILGVLLITFIIYKLYQWSTYNYVVFIYKKVGDALVKTIDKAKQVRLDGNYMFHYMGLNKYSSVVDPKYFMLFSSKQFGIFPKTTMSFSVFQYGEKIVPAHVGNPEIIPIDIDVFNYLQSRIKANQAKYSKTNLLLQLAPIIGVGLIVIMFIVGMIFYTKHIENIATLILSNAQTIAQKGIENSGVIQVIPTG